MIRRIALRERVWALLACCVSPSGIAVANACPLAPVQIESWAAWGKVLKALDKADQ